MKYITLKMEYIALDGISIEIVPAWKWLIRE
jgi:hypothetical protein